MPPAGAALCFVYVNAKLYHFGEETHFSLAAGVRSAGRRAARRRGRGGRRVAIVRGGDAPREIAALVFVYTNAELYDCGEEAHLSLATGWGRSAGRGG